MEFTVDDIAACKPLNKLLTVLYKKGYAIEKSKVGDYHFNELYFVLSGDKNENDLEDLKIENIEKISSNTFFCKCHWSMVEIRDKSISQ